MPYPRSHPSYYDYSRQPMPEQYFPPQQQQGGMPSNIMQILAYLAAQQQEQTQDPESTGALPNVERSLGNPYFTTPNRPSPTGLNPVGRFNDMVLRKSAELASRLNDGRAAVEGAKQEQTERDRLVQAITHPAPTAPYNISSTATGTGEQYPNGEPMALQSRYGKGSVSFAPPGMPVHGTFGPEHMQFGGIGGAGEAQPTSGDPLETTYQQQMILDHINKTLGRKR